MSWFIFKVLGKGLTMVFYLNGANGFVSAPWGFLLCPVGVVACPLPRPPLEGTSCHFNLVLCRVMGVVFCF